MRGRQVLIAAVPGLVVVLVAAWATGLLGRVPGLGGASGGPRFAVQDQPTRLGWPWARVMATFTVTSADREPVGPRQLFRLEPPRSAQDAARRAVAGLRLSGDAYPSRDAYTGTVTWTVWPAGPNGRLSVNDRPGRSFRFVRDAQDADPWSPAPDPAPPAPATSTPPSGPAVAESAARTFLDAIGYDAGADLAWSATAFAGGRALLEGRLRATGDDGPALWTFTVDRSGLVLAANGLLATPRSLGEYPTISVADAIGRLDQQWLPHHHVLDQEPPVCPAPPAVRLSGFPAALPEDRPVALPARSGGSVSPYGPDVLVVDGARPGYALMADSRCSEYVTPVVWFTEGGYPQIPVLALADEAIERLPPAAAAGPTTPPAARTSPS